MVALIESLVGRLEARRRVLGMSYPALAARCGLSEPTVKRILAGRAPEAAFRSVAAIAEALGASVRLDEADVEDVRLEQAHRKAEGLVALVGGTSALEGQGVDERERARMIERTVHELLAGSNRRLWSA